MTDCRAIWAQYEKGMSFKSGIDLYETVRNNENFYIGKQWEGVQANGLPTPVFNIIRRVVLFLVSTVASDNVKISATPLREDQKLDWLTDVINREFEALFEHCKMGKLLREFVRDSAVDGDGCLYAYFDPDVETGQTARGAIRVQTVENTRVVFGNPNNRDVQTQPYIIIAKRELVERTKRRAKKNGQPDEIRADSDETGNAMSAQNDGLCTVLTKLRRDPETGTIMASETTSAAVVRKEWDTGQKLYPIAWMPWDYIQNCYHGQAAVTGLLPNQVFINKMFAMTMISLMTTAYPKVVYDGTRIKKWDARVGQAIAVNGGDIGSVAKTIDPATISPQVGQFIDLCIKLTKDFMGATDAALGDTRPDNTSAIIALQKASAVPMELVRQNLWQCVEDMGNIWLDLMRVYYGVRMMPGEFVEGAFDFGMLNHIPLSLKLDVGGSAYWSEIAQMNTLDNLLMQGKIDVVDYLERVPTGYIAKKQELVDKMSSQGGEPSGELTGAGTI